MTSGLTVREIRSDDDFGQIHKLILDTKRASSGDKRLQIVSTDNLRKSYFPEKMDSTTPTGKGYVVENRGQILAFMGVHRRNNDGIIDYGVKTYDTQLLLMLLNECVKVVSERGGKQLFYFASTRFAQIRNQEISVLEQLGFVSDEFARLSTRLRLDQWAVPDRVESSNIIATAEKDIGDFYNILIEDGESSTAELFKHQYRHKEPSSIFLSLQNNKNDIIAIAYYKVKKVMPQHDRLSATAFNVHFRPDFELSRKEKKQFIQAVLYSMKQLDLIDVNSSILLNNADTFTLMVREGFEEFHGSFLRFSKRISELRK